MAGVVLLAFGTPVSAEDAASPSEDGEKVGEMAGADALAPLKEAAAKLGEARNYEWSTSMEWGGPQAMESSGKKGSGGFFLLTMPGRDGPMEVLLRNKKGVVSREGSWELIETNDADGGGAPGRGRFLARMVENFEAPAADLIELVNGAGEFKAGDDGTFVAALDEESAGDRLSFRRRGRRGGDQANGGFQPPEVKGASGTVTVTVADGIVSKYELKLNGTMSFNGEDREIARTTVVEFSEVGSTRFDVAEEAVGLMME